MKKAAIATWKMSLKGMKECSRILKESDDASTSIVEGVKIIENEPSFRSVGYGGLPDENGHVALDAGFMNGRDLRFGAVGSLEGIESPISVAYLLSREKVNNFLSGPGAFRYAVDHGFRERNNLTPEAYEIYLKRKEEEKEILPYDGHDTVCFIASDSKDICCGVSTSGLFMKHQGRLGDSPLCGAGYYADNNYGAACCTGMGEDITKGALAKDVVMRMQFGEDVMTSCQKALDYLMNHNPDIRPISIIGQDSEGNFGVATNCDFPFTVWDETNGIRTYLSKCVNGKTVIEEADFDSVALD